MRLKGRLKDILKITLTETFGTADTILFGSRTDEYAIGGDIDIAIKTDMSSSEFRKNKIMFFTSLIRRNLDLKIDLVQYNNTMDALLKEEINKNGISL